MSADRKEEALFLKRVKDLSTQAYHKGICTFTDFLGLNELNLFQEVEKTLLSSSCTIWGGYEYAERKIIAFDETGRPMDHTAYNEWFPIACIQITPVNVKYSDAFTHRDYLGAILNLGIDRSKTGDILIKEHTSYVFCNPVISEFIMDHLTRVKHTTVRCEQSALSHYEFKPSLQEINGTVSSVRLDSLMALAFHTSRSSLSSLITGGKVYINGKLTLSGSCQLKEGDIVSVRGMGRFIYDSTSHQTKKGRYSVSVLKY